MWYTTADAKKDATRQRVKHLLTDSNVTACGLARHFTMSVAPEIAITRHDVTCELCRSSELYRKYCEDVENELKARMET